MENVAKPENTSTATVIAPAPQSKPRPSKVFIFLIVFVLLVGVGAGAYFLGMQNLQPAAQPITTQVVIKPTPTVDPTANWKTYNNSTYGFSFKYPSEWKLGEINDKDVGKDEYHIDLQYQKKADIPAYAYIGSDFGVDVSVLLKQNISIYDWLKSDDYLNSGNTNWQLLAIKYGKPTILGGVNGIDVKVPESEFNIGFFEFIAFIHSSRGYLISATGDKKTDIENNWQQILSTFTFTSDSQTASTNPGEGQKINQSITPPVGTPDH